MKNRCSICGKFRKENELVLFSDSDSDGWEVSNYLECRDCMSPADEAMFFKKEQPSEG